jgi:hypothetical protein
LATLADLTDPTGGPNKGNIMTPANKHRDYSEEARLEKEIQELTEQLSPPTTNEDGNPEAPASTPEEETWKKRYGDLRKFENSLREEIKNLKDGTIALQRQLGEALKKEVKYPSDEAEFTEWVKEYPDVVRNIETLVLKKNQKLKEEQDERFQALEERERTLARKNAYQELLGYHPDFGEIKNSQEFHDWIKIQPKWVEDALFQNETDAYLAARAVDLYKADTEKLKKKSKATDTRDSATQSVRTNGIESPNSGPKKWSESEIEKMKSNEFAKHEKEIMEAMRTGNFIYDLSAAR